MCDAWGRRPGSIMRILPVLLLAILGAAAKQTTAFPTESNTELELEGCPSYYILGAADCGVDELASFVRTGLALPTETSVRAPHIFDNPKAWTMLSERSYANVVDATSSYLRNAHAPGRMKAFCNFRKAPKFVVSLCDPVNRTWDQFAHDEAFDQLNRPRYFLNGRRKLSPGTLVQSYRKCITESIPLLQDCLKVSTYQECQEVLYGYANMGASQDALGTTKPCSGVVLGSLFDRQLEAWEAAFPRIDFLTLDKRQWEKSPDDALDLISDHFKIPRNGKPLRRRNKAPKLQRFDSVSPPADAQAELAEFLSQWDDWKTQIDWGRFEVAQRKKRIAKSMMRKALRPLLASDVAEDDEGAGARENPLSGGAWADFRDMISEQEFTFSQMSM